MNMRSMLRMGIAATSLAAFAGIVVNAQSAPPSPDAAPAAQPATEPVTYVAPLITEDFESGTINTAVWTPTTAPSNAGGGGRGRGGRAAAAAPATMPGGANPATNPAGAAARGGRRGGRGGRGGGGPVVNPTLEIVQDTVAHGKYALHVHYPANASGGYAMLITKLPDAVKTHLFGRVYIKVTPKLPTGHCVLFFAGTENWPISNFLEIGDYQGKFQPSFQQNDTVNSPSRGETTKHGVEFPTDKWFCYEWEMNDTPDTINTWIDGKTADSFSYSYPKEGDTGLVNHFSNFGIGTRLWGVSPDAYDVYYDDLAIGTGRIGPVKE